LEGDLLTWRRGAPAFDPQEAPRQIGIISPFRAQVQLLREQVAARFPRVAAQIEIDTVERFQGREKEIIMVSFVTAGRTSAFLANHRRLNVTLTRARSKLILLGDLYTLQNTSPLLRDLIESAAASSPPREVERVNETKVFQSVTASGGAEAAAQ
jgi:superfamily I DNA and/or RNA helicase